LIDGNNSLRKKENVFENGLNDFVRFHLKSVMLSKKSDAGLKSFPLSVGTHYNGNGRT